MVPGGATEVHYVVGRIVCDPLSALDTRCQKPYYTTLLNAGACCEALYTPMISVAHDAQEKTGLCWAIGKRCL